MRGVVERVAPPAVAWRDGVRLERLWLLLFPVASGLIAYVGVTRGLTYMLLPIAVCAGAAFTLVAMSRPWIALLPIGVALPFAGYLVVLWSGQGMSVVFDAMTLLCFLPLLFRVLLRRSPSSLVSGGQLLVWAFLGIVTLAIFNPDGGGIKVGLWGLRRTALPALLFFVAYHLDLSAPRNLRGATRTFAAVGVVVALWGLKQHLWGPTGAEHAYASQVGPFWVAGELRIFSTFMTPWGFSGYLAALGFAALGLGAGARTLACRRLHAAQALLFAVTLVFTYMRGPLLGFLVGLAFLGVALVGRRLGRRGVLAAFLAILATYAAFITFVGSDVAGRITPDGVVLRRLVSFVAPHREEGMADRFRVWEQIWPIVAGHPLGLGLGSSGGVAARFDDALRFGAIHSDNVHLAMLLEVGWLGALLFVAVTAWVLMRGLRQVQLATDEGTRWIGHGALAFLIMMAVAHLVTPLMFEPGVGQLFWIASGLVVNPTIAGGLRPVAARDEPGRRTARS